MVLDDRQQTPKVIKIGNGWARARISARIQKKLA
jgi:hypothetical protein